MSKSLKGTRTEQNLLKAFAGESQARNRYTFFASQARKEGLVQIAEIFAETAEQEKEHAKRFFSFLEGGDVGLRPLVPARELGHHAEQGHRGHELLDLGLGLDGSVWVDRIRPEPRLVHYSADGRLLREYPLAEEVLAGEGEGLCGCRVRPPC